MGSKSEAKPRGGDRKRLEGLGSSLLLSGIVGTLALAGAFAGAERASLSGRFALRGPRPLRAPVAIVAIDEASLARYGQMPWSRVVFAKLLDRLTALGASAVGFDIAFVEPGRRQPGEDQALAEAIRHSGRTILTVYRPLESQGLGGTALVDPLGLLASASAGFGLAHFTTVPTFDIWQVQPEQLAGRKLVPTLGLAVAREARATWLADRSAPRTAASRAGTLPRLVPSTSADNPRQERGREGPLPAFGTAPIALDFVGPPGSIPTYSVRDVLAGHVARSAISGHAVFVGATAAGMPDTAYSTPFPGPMAGVEIHATACENFLSGRNYQQLPRPAKAGLWLLLAIGPGPWLTRASGTPRRRLLWLAGSLAVVLGCAWAGFLSGWLLPIAAPATLVAVLGIAGILGHEGELLRERARLLGWYAAELKREAKRQREQIDGELHDEAQQLVIAMNRQVRRLRRKNEEPGLASLEDLTQRVLDEILRVRKALVPRTLSREGLVPAIGEMARDLSDRGGPLVDVRVDSWPARLDPLLESELFWLVKEALNNVNKHAQARNVEIVLSCTANSLGVSLEDDGVGFAVEPLERPPQTHEHTGLHRMWVRARGLGGNLVVESNPGKGTRLVLEAPIRPSAAPAASDPLGTV